MTPKERADQIVIMMYGHVATIEAARNCAIIAVGELITEASDKLTRIGRVTMSNKEYWQAVYAELTNSKRHPGSDTGEGE
jgi:hypothetical protein